VKHTVTARGRHRDRANVEAIKAAARFDAIARELVPDLEERSPGDFWGRCPFHDEVTPSFHVRSKAGHFKCFGCGASGDVLAFVMKARGLDFRAALAYLALRTGLPRRQPSSTSTVVPSAVRAELHPSPEDIAGLLAVTIPAHEDDEASAWLATRRLDATVVAAGACLARVVPRGAKVPPWACCNGRSWAVSGYRVVVPMFGSSSCAPLSVRARRIVPGEPKAVAPRGHTVRGVVMANQVACRILVEHCLPTDWPTGHPFRVAIAEGEPDFLTLATHWATRPPAPAVIGVVSGSWTSDLAACIPDGSLVEIRTDPDPPGDRMARTINASLGRRCKVERVVPMAPQP
jgi:CHC2 zinc finger